MKPLSDWLEIMLAEIARKREEAARAAAELEARRREMPYGNGRDGASSATVPPSTEQH